MTPIRVLPLGLLVLLMGCTLLPENVGPERLYWRAPVLLPDVTPELRRPGFWIGRLQAPDEVVMTQDQMAVFQKSLLDRKLVRSLPEPPGAPPLTKQAAGLFGYLSQRTLYFPDGRKVDPAWWAAQEPQLNLGAPFEVRFALSVARADQRLIPDNIRLTADPLDFDFDELQNSGYDPGTPFEVGPTSADGQWLWTHGVQSDGWVDRRSLALCDEATLKDWQTRDTVVVTAPRAELWSDPGLRQWRTALRMGTRLPVEADEGTVWRVTIPVAGPDGRATFTSAWVAKADAVKGSLPYTRRVILQQAFALLDRPYGWGDSYGEQDCSRFLAEVFSTVGVMLPRNSASQGVAGPGPQFARRDPLAVKVAAVEAADPVTTLVQLDGHILLYLGIVDGKPYGIHCLWAYSQMDGTKEVVRVVNGVAVSTLFLGEGSRRGALLERILNLSSVVPRVPAPSSMANLEFLD